MLPFVEIKRRIYGVVCDSDSDCKRKVIKRWKDERKKVKVPSGSPNCEYRIVSHRITSSKEIQAYYRHLVESGGTRINRRCALQDIFLFLCNANNSHSPLFSFIDFILMGFLHIHSTFHSPLRFVDDLETTSICEWLFSSDLLTSRGASRYRTEQAGSQPGLGNTECSEVEEN